MNKQVKILLIIGLLIIIIVIALVIKFSKSDSKLLLTTTAVTSTTTTVPYCILSSDQTTVNNIKNNVNSLANTVSTMNPKPTSDVLATFNSALTNINSQITSLLALPICCSGQNQQYDSTTNKCQCSNPYGLDQNGNCTVSCTFPQAIWTGAACGCNTGYLLNSLMNGCGAMVTGRYVTIKQSQTNYINLQQIQIFSPSGSKYTPVKLTSSSLNSSSYPLTNLINGNTSTSNMSSTNSEANAYITVDLGSDQQIGQVIIYNRTTCSTSSGFSNSVCKNRIIGCYILITQNDGTQTYQSDKIVSPSASIYTFSPPLTSVVVTSS